MSISQYALFCLTVLISLLISLERMGTALDDADIGSFCVWTCVAGTIAGLPTLL
ncbi:hypothetical protein [Leptolyngbya sp. NIES-2104]|uniref:hypothetical protein n=1 Tax=Leptolyngbya sp. NIES-2104 TaxID=1552121 RepID=UPI0006EC4EE7|nr:hypothetical protein [Leptolyngbya sp. NIES-2104]GAP94132.1 hypothetical protein NIES2104_06420 [Leptolyngbya sp. NIES-2104]